MITEICKGVLFASISTGVLLVGWQKNKEHLLGFTKHERYAAMALLFWSVLVGYMTLLTFTCDPIVNEVGFIPLHTLQEIFEYRVYDLAYQLIFNILMFVPFGILIPYLFKQTKSFSSIMTVGFLISLAIECTQLFIGRSFDFDDILCNTLGAMLGYGLLLSWETVNQLRNHKGVNLKQKLISAFSVTNLTVLALTSGYLIIH